MKIATSPIEPVAVMMMTCRIVEPVTNLAVWLVAAVVIARLRLARPALIGALGDLHVLALLVKPSGLALRLDQRLRRDRLDMPLVAAGLSAFDGLQRQPRLVAAAHVLEDVA